MSNIYKIEDDFQVGETDNRVLVLDREYDFSQPAPRGIAIIDSVEYKYNLNSIRKWVTIKSGDTFKGKTVKFE